MCERLPMPRQGMRTKVCSAPRGTQRTTRHMAVMTARQSAVPERRAHRQGRPLPWASR